MCRLAWAGAIKKEIRRSKSFIESTKDSLAFAKDGLHLNRVTVRQSKDRFWLQDYM